MIERRADRLNVTVPMIVPNAKALLEAGRVALNGPNETVDLTEVTEADSSALAVMLGWLRSAEAAGRQLQFTGVPSGVRALADLYGVGEILSLA